MNFIAKKLSDGSNKGKLAFYCRMLHVSRQGFYEFRKRQGRPWKYKALAKAIDEVKALVWRYFMSYWNNRRICSSNGGLPPIIKRKRYYDALYVAA